MDPLARNVHVAVLPLSIAAAVLLMQAVHLAYALDLMLFVPGCVLASILLWRRNCWGYVLATAVLVFGALYQVNYMVALVFQAEAGVPGAPGWSQS